VVGVESATS